MDHGARVDIAQALLGEERGFINGVLEEAFDNLPERAGKGEIVKEITISINPINGLHSYSSNPPAILIDVFATLANGNKILLASQSLYEAIGWYAKHIFPPIS